MELFEPQGRLIPAQGERVYAATDRRYFSLDQPVTDYSSIHANVSKFLNIPSLEQSISVASFKERCENIRSMIVADEMTRHLFEGVHVPFLMNPPQVEQDLGKELDSVLIDAAGRSFIAKFPKFDFRNYEQGKMEGNVTVVPGVRYESLLKAWKKGPVAGWYFPNCMAGFAIPDQRALVKRLPEFLILSGPVEAAFAFIGIPELLMKKDNYPHLLALAAVRPAQDHFFYFMEAYGWNLTFNQRSMIGAVSEYYAGGLTVIG